MGITPVPCAEYSSHLDRPVSLEASGYNVLGRKVLNTLVSSRGMRVELVDEFIEGERPDLLNNPAVDPRYSGIFESGITHRFETRRRIAIVYVDENPDTRPEGLLEGLSPCTDILQ